MNKSENIGQLALALSKLQGEITDAPKNKKGYNYQYADLESFLKIVRPLCFKYELAISQLCVSDPSNAHLIGVETLLTHSSGEWISSTMYMPIEEKKGMSAAQCSGTVLSYCRRYALAAVLNITQVEEGDEDSVPAGSRKFETVNAVNAENWHSRLLAHLDTIDQSLKAMTAKGWCAIYNVEKLSHLNDDQIKEILGIK